MNLMNIIQETALMMGFTFIVGIAFAYVLKGMTFFFSRFSGEGLSVWMGRGRVWARAYRMNLTHTYRNIWSLACTDDGSPEGAAQDGLAEYHFGNLRDGEKLDTEMSRLYELHHGKI